MAIEQWGLFGMPHLLWHGASFYNGQRRGPVTPTPIPERLAVELSLSLLTTQFCRGLDSKNQPSAFGAIALTHCVDAVVSWFVDIFILEIYKQILKFIALV